MREMGLKFSGLVLHPFFVYIMDMGCLGHWQKQNKMGYYSSNRVAHMEFLLGVYTEDRAWAYLSPDACCNHWTIQLSLILLRFWYGISSAAIKWLE